MIKPWGRTCRSSLKLLNGLAWKINRKRNTKFSPQFEQYFNLKHVGSGEIDAKFYKPILTLKNLFLKIATVGSALLILSFFF